MVTPFSYTPNESHCAKCRQNLFYHPIFQTNMGAKGINIIEMLMLLLMELVDIDYIFVLNDFITLFGL